MTQQLRDPAEKLADPSVLGTNSQLLNQGSAMRLLSPNAKRVNSSLKNFQVRNITPASLEGKSKVVSKNQAFQNVKVSTFDPNFFPGEAGQLQTGAVMPRTLAASGMKNLAKKPESRKHLDRPVTNTGINKAESNKQLTFLEFVRATSHKEMQVMTAAKSSGHMETLGSIQRQLDYSFESGDEQSEMKQLPI